MSDFRFEKGLAYVGTSTIDRKRQKVFLVVGRRGEVVSFSHVSAVVRGMVNDCGGTEIVKMQDDDGFDYMMSARLPVDVGEAFHVAGLCKA